MRNYKLDQGWQHYGKVKELKTLGTKTICKYTYGSLDLAQYLIKEQYDSVEFIGVVTDQCILSNAVIAKAALPESKIMIDATCVASNDDDLHEKALDIMESLKFQVINRKEGKNE